MHLIDIYTRPETYFPDLFVTPRTERQIAFQKKLEQLKKKIKKLIKSGLY